MDTLLAIVPSLIVGVFMACFNKSQKKREKKIDHQSDVRRKECLLQLEIQAATADLARATAIALKRGTANGEVEEGLSAYAVAKAKYYKFLNTQAIDHISGT